MKYAIFLFFIPILCFSGGDSPTSPNYLVVHKPYSATGCQGAKTQQEVDQCSKTRLLKAESQMEILVDMLTKNYNENEPKLDIVFIKAQKAWSDYMILACDYQTYYSKGGSGYQSILDTCKESQLFRAHKLFTLDAG